MIKAIIDIPIYTLVINVVIGINILIRIMDNVLRNMQIIMERNLILRERNKINTLGRKTK